MSMALELDSKAHAHFSLANPFCFPTPKEKDE